ncbi:MAG: chemotaxis protein CheD [Oscillospiraceae bacterium]|jgi:chemotaxis protein CheD|nr:chemotaxis protein CheD [Oscillospiraceae bacterium]
MDQVVGIGGFAVSSNASDIIKTFALSTCVGLVYYSMRKRVMGMSHIQLPNSRAMRSDDKLSRFADTAPEHLMKEMMQKFGVSKSELLISLYGGVDSQGSNDCFKIGEKNLFTVKSTLKSLGLVYSEVDTGGNDSRTLVAYVSSGVVEVIKRPMLIRGEQKARPQFGKR